MKTTLSYHFIRLTKTNKNKQTKKKKQKFGYTQLLKLKETVLKSTKLPISPSMM